MKDKDIDNSWDLMEKKIRKNIDDYIDKEIVCVTIEFLPKAIGKKPKKPDDEIGVIKVEFSVRKIVVVDKKNKVMSLEFRNDTNSVLTLYYRETELSKYKLTHMKPVAMAMLHNKIKNINMFKRHHLEDIEKYLK
jgi:hypothetical protein